MDLQSAGWEVSQRLPVRMEFRVFAFRYSTSAGAFDGPLDAPTGSGFRLFIFINFTAHNHRERTMPFRVLVKVDNLIIADPNCTIELGHNVLFVGTL